MRVYMCGLKSHFQPRLPSCPPHSCGAMNSSLALIRDWSDLEGADQQTFYYTGHTFRADPESRPDIPNLANLNCTVDCELTSEHKCVTVSGQGIYRFQSCEDGETKYSCMYPAFCPEGYSPYRGLCYKVIPAADTFLHSYEECMKEGSDIAFPENVNDIQFLISLVEKTEQKPIEESLKVMLGIFCPTFWLHSVDIPGYRLCGGGYSLLDILPGGNFSMTTSPPTTEASYAICKHHGVMKCWDEPRSPSANMTRVWNNSTDYKTTVTYACDEGYYISGETWKFKSVQSCRGLFGNWYPPVLSCVREGCHGKLPKAPPSVTRTLGYDYQKRYGNVTYTCPDGMVTLKNVTTQIVECKRLKSIYTFIPDRVDDCSGCAGKPVVANATTIWNDETVYSVGSYVFAWCYRDHYVYWRKQRQKVNCKESGWQEVPGCEYMPSCRSELPASVVEPILSDEFPREGTNATYECPPAMGTLEGGAKEVITCNATPSGMQLLPNVIHSCGRCMAEPEVDAAHTDWNSSSLYLLGSTVNATCVPTFFHAEGKSRLLTCNPTGWEVVSGCMPGCLREPPVAGEGAVQEGFTDRRVGASVYYHCMPDKYFKKFGYLTSFKTSVVCRKDGEWHLTDAELKCEEVVWQAPPPLEGTVNTLPNWNIWIGTTIEYMCQEGLFSVTGAAATNATAALSGWTVFDPDFRCVPACLKKPEVKNAEIAWDSDTLYLLHSNVTTTCHEGHLGEGDVASRVVECTRHGWETISGCYAVCMAAPPPAGENMAMRKYNFTGVGASVEYDCTEGLYVKRQGESVSSTSAVCGPDLTWHLSDGSLDCDKPLGIDPPSLPEGVVMQVLHPPFYEGLSFTIMCAEGLFSATGVDFSTVSVTSEGWSFRIQTFPAVLRASQNHTYKTP
ncbi:LOW QUALITY PROTEIN: complement receptor type 1-like [Penaeus monodon]|uniref:LOW QUALITY PROTEIN: complement receptor type 1-like n=1 Tax=Penaeus monodon TaxID=6687 RepID=UPI0018A7E23F|nr:LOW QUALITY PROTEIN: complement receptor type 1-like [Penaeus monodon]